VSAAGLKRLQGLVTVLGIAVAVLAVVAGVGYSPLPQGSPSSARWLHPLLLVLGGLGAMATMGRKRAIDVARWQVIEDEHTTQSEREHAHREAESELKTAAATFLLAPVALGLLLVYQFRDPERFTSADLLAVSPLLGFLAVLGWQAWRGRER
jgi:hypothetical protein